MSPVFNAINIIVTLKEMAAEMGNHNEELRQLDATIGDGDMGITAELDSKAIAEYLANTTEDDIGKLLTKCGMYFNKASSSTFGTLLASAFMGAGKVLLGRKEIDIRHLVLLGQSAVDGIKKRGKAEVGEKTMLDSLILAVEAFKEVLANGTDYNVAIEAAIKAAKAGMAETVRMKAKHSRASYRPDGGIGVQDAGATAMYYLIESFGRSLASHVAGQKPLL
ncbi:dihydroxyacetone kinase subunit L [Chloroflexota bacterium]